MEACQGVSKIISDAAKIFHPAESRPVKPDDDDDDVAINNSDKRSIDPQPVSCQRNVLLQTAESSAVTDQNVAGQGRGNKRKLDDLEERAIAVEPDLGAGSQQDRSKTTERIKPRIKNMPTTFIPDEKAARSRFWKRHVSTPKYASFLRIFRKEETDQLHGNSSSRRNEREKSQHRRRLSTERYNPEIKYNAVERRKKLKKFQRLKRLFLADSLFDYWT